MCNLTIDIGNTATKVLVYESNAVLLRKVLKLPDLKSIQKIILKYKPQAAILCSVARTPSAIRTYLKKTGQFIELNGLTKVPVKMNYKTPETLGADRLAGIVAASKLFPGKNVLVIDLGTCIKYDFLSSKNSYLGGSISPGLYMRLKSLHEFTDRLPLLEPAHLKDFVGKNTQESMLSGVQVGILAELEGFINRYKKKYGSLKVILSGGDAQRFAGQLKLSIFAAPDLVNIGLNEILNFNAQK